jgi:DNA-binding response OmpR family regulator
LLIIAPVILVGFFVHFSRKKLRLTAGGLSGNPDTILLGDFRFDKAQMTLSYAHEKTELSGKQSESLFLLYSNKNKIYRTDQLDLNFVILSKHIFYFCERSPA